MISFELSEVETLAQSMFREFALKEVRPYSNEIDSSCAIPHELLRKCREMGLVEALVSEYDESRSRVQSCVILEELGWADTATAIAVGSTLAFVQAIVDQGTDSQRQQLADIPGSAVNAAVLVQEPGIASHPHAFATQVREHGKSLLLSGTKSFVPRAAECDRFLVLVNSASGPQAVIVPADSPGVKVEAPTGTMGLRGLSLAKVQFEDVELPASARLGGDNGCQIQSIIASSRIGLAAILTGLSRAVFEFITPYTKERIAHGSALAQKQSVAFRLADMRIDVPAMRWMCWRAASALEKGRDASREARLAQLYCGERALAIADEGVQLMGGHGYIRDNPVERWLRDARTVSLLEGLVGV